MKTLNQLYQVFQNFSTNHGQLNGYGTGDLWEVGMTEQLQYPILWVNPTQSKMIKGASGYATTDTTFRVFILDRVKPDLTNADEVLSDMNQIGHDLVKDIDSNPLFLTGSSYTFNSSDITMEYVGEKLKDNVSGVYVELSFTTPFNAGCSTPLNS